MGQAVANSLLGGKFVVQQLDILLQLNWDLDDRRDKDDHVAFGLHVVNGITKLANSAWSFHMEMKVLQHHHSAFIFSAQVSSCVDDLFASGLAILYR